MGAAALEPDRRRVRIILWIVTIEELFSQQARRIRGIEGATAEEIEELERLVGRRLPRELRAYLERAGREPGNLRFVQTHKVLRPSIAEMIRYHRPARSGRRKSGVRGRIFFGDGAGCQDCGPAFLALEAPEELGPLVVDPEDPPVIGYDDEDPLLLAPSFTEFVRSAIPERPLGERPPRAMKQ